MTSDLKRTIMQVGDSMDLREIKYFGFDALVGDYNDVITAMALVGIDSDEVQSAPAGSDLIIY